ncbi:Rab3 GTPase-activating protein non-catalytic subunit, partial [Nowakowskiella sp. JEL0078]
TSHLQLLSNAHEAREEHKPSPAHASPDSLAGNSPQAQHGLSASGSWDLSDWPLVRSADPLSQPSATPPNLHSFPASAFSNLKVSTALNSRYWLLSSSVSFLLFSRTSNDPFEKLSLMSSRSVLDDADQDDNPAEITAAACFPMFLPSNPNKPQICVAIGYSTGNFHLYNEDSILILSQFLHPSPILSISLRAALEPIHSEPLKNNSINDQVISNTDDELNILFDDRTLVEINGSSLWLAIRMSSSQNPDPPSLTYSKKEFKSQQSITEIVSFGPITTSGYEPSKLGSLITSKYKSENSGSIAGFSYNPVYIGFGKNPMISFYSSPSTPRTFSTLVSFATTGLSSVTTAVFSFAKSFWGISSEPAPPLPLNLQSQPEFAPASSVAALFSLSDPASQRCIKALTLSSPSPAGKRGGQQQRWAAATDSLGRVLVVDLLEGEVVRLIKGVRGAQTAWMESEKGILVLAVYSARGTLEVWAVRGARRIAKANVGIGLRLIQVAVGDETIGSAIARGEPVLGVGCTGGPAAVMRMCKQGLGKAAVEALLLNPEGEFKKVVLDWD